MKNKSGSLCKYTTTVLPAFLIPYGRHTVDKILGAISSVTNTNISLFDASCKLNISHKDERTLIKYLDRAQNRIEDWTLKLTSFHTADLCGKIPSESIPAKSEESKFMVALRHFKAIVDWVANRYEILPGLKALRERQGYCLAVIGLSTKALGP